MSSTLQPISCSRRLSNSSASLNSDHESEKIRISPSNVSLRSYQSNPSDDDSDTERLGRFSPVITHNNPSVQNHSTPTIKITHPGSSHSNVEKMRRKLKFFFMNPIEKWRAKRRFPYKLLLQLFKIIFVTLQGVLFGNATYSHVNFVKGNTQTLSHFFLYAWDDPRDVSVYPPAEGAYSVYRIDDFYYHVNYAINMYSQLREKAIGSYSYAHESDVITSVEFCKSFYKKGKIFSYNESYDFDNEIVQRCLTIYPLTKINDTQWAEFDIESYLAANNFTINFHRLVKIELIMQLKTVYINDNQEPDCYKLDVKIVYDNSNHDGQLKISLQLLPILIDCRGTTLFNDSRAAMKGFLYVLDLIVITICAFSLILCSRAVVRAQRLKRTTMKFFETNFSKKLTLAERFEFLNLWYVLIVINDVLIIVGSIIKMQIERTVTSEEIYLACTSMLGVGMLLVWFGVLRYMKFFPKYNILILTLQRACPEICRFLLCAGFIYAGFVFNGWIILGPYHLKFRTLATTSECLFSLINGDDMFASFAVTADKPLWIWWYSRVYFYTFISLFIYVVMSLFIALIMDAYDTIKNFHQHGFPKSDVMQFASECPDDPNSGVYRDEHSKLKQFFTSLKLCACCRRREFESYEPI